MPLIEGSSEESLHENIKKLIGEGKSRAQAVAIAYEIRDKTLKGDMILEPGCENFFEDTRKPTNQAGAANPLGFVYGGLSNQYPLGG